MSNVVRFGVSIPKELLEKFDEIIKRKGFAKRSEAIRHLIMKYIYEEEKLEEERIVIGVLTLVYDHKEKHTDENLTELQHRYLDIIRANLHIHINERKCSEVIILRGKFKDIKEICGKLSSLKGIIYDKLIIIH